jgi:cytidylate kinase
MIGTSDRVVGALARLNRYVDTSDTASKASREPITIALSRQAGAGGYEIAQAVSARLGWPVYDHELLDRIAEEKGLNARLLASLDERHVGWLEDAFRAYCAPHSGHQGVYLRTLLGLLASLGKAGHCIIVGHGAPQVLPADTTLRVRVIAPRAIRVANVQKNRKLSLAEAERWIDTTERERLRFVERHFHVNDAEPLGYDLVLNVERLNMEECATLIVEAARAREKHAPLAKLVV